MKASASDRSVDLTEALARLHADRQAIPWPQRRQIVAQIAGPLAGGQALEPFCSLLLILVEDPKWEVRRDVAEILANIPDHDLALLAERLAADSHNYVRRAAKQSIERRRAAARKMQKRKRGIELVLALYEELEEQHGSAVAEQARRLGEQMYFNLMGATVHEMRSVLTALKEDNARIIARQDAGDLDPLFLRRKSLKIAERLLFLERLLADMRNYSQPIPAERPPVLVADLLTEARSIVSADLAARGISTRRVRLEVTAPPELQVKASRVHIVAAILNTLRNAYEALPCLIDGLEGQVFIDVSVHDRKVLIAVRDTGIGIPAADLKELRQCLPGRTSKRPTGTGFGLCSARRNLEAHGGRLTIDRTEDVGTTVTLILPA